MCVDVGFECGVQYVAQRCLDAALKGQAATHTPRPISGLDAEGASRGCRRVRARAGGEEANLDPSLSALASHVVHGPQSHQVCAPPPSPLTGVAPCADVPHGAPHHVAALLAALRQAPPDVSDVAGGGGAGADALVRGTVAPMMRGGLAPVPSTHPKLWALLQYLQKYKWVGWGGMGWVEGSGGMMLAQGHVAHTAAGQGSAALGSEWM